MSFREDVRKFEGELESLVKGLVNVSSETVARILHKKAVDVDAKAVAAAVSPMLGKTVHAHEVKENAGKLDTSQEGTTQAKLEGDKAVKIGPDDKPGADDGRGAITDKTNQPMAAAPDQSKA